MPTPAEAALAELKRFGLSLPGTEPKSPWPGHDDVAVNHKTFAYLSTQDGHLAVSLKLPISAKEALRRPDAAPAAYGLGKSGWVRMAFPGKTPVPLEMLKRWMMESYRAQAPKRLLKTLEGEQPWIKAGALPDSVG